MAKLYMWEWYVIVVRLIRLERFVNSRFPSEEYTLLGLCTPRLPWYLLQAQLSLPRTMRRRSPVCQGFRPELFPFPRPAHCLLPTTLWPPSAQISDQTFYGEHSGCDLQK